jgi:hypothetical protein
MSSHDDSPIVVVEPRHDTPVEIRDASGNVIPSRRSYDVNFNQVFVNEHHPCFSIFNKQRPLKQGTTKYVSPTLGGISINGVVSSLDERASCLENNKKAIIQGSMNRIPLDVGIDVMQLQVSKPLDPLMVALEQGYSAGTKGGRNTDIRGLPTNVEAFTQYCHHINSGDGCVYTANGQWTCKKRPFPRYNLLFPQRCVSGYPDGRHYSSMQLKRHAISS